jgi:hypothetical protein
MPASIINNTIKLQPDNLGYQAFRIPLSQQSGAETIVLYYKGYVDNTPSNTSEDGTNYGWNNDAFFGLSFNGTLSANTGGIVGWSNGNDVNWVANPPSISTHAPFSTNSGYSQMVPCTFDNINYISNGSTNPSSSSRSGGGVYSGAFCPTTTNIFLSGARKFLGILKVAKHPTNTQQIVISYGVNWENMNSSNFGSALTSTSTTWITQSLAVTETTNYRSNYLNALSSTINMPNWIVGKWPSVVVGREFVLTDLKVEYYRVNI